MRTDIAICEVCVSTVRADERSKLCCCVRNIQNWFTSPFPYAVSARCSESSMLIGLLVVY